MVIGHYIAAPVIITPEPIPPPPAVVTFTSTTAGRTLAITASRTASILLPVSAGTVVVGFVPGSSTPVLEPLAAGVEVVPLPYSQPANKPVPKMIASTRVRTIIAPVRNPPEERPLDGGGPGGFCWK